jgi:cytochrome b
LGAPRKPRLGVAVLAQGTTMRGELRLDPKLSCRPECDLLGCRVNIEDSFMKEQSVKVWDIGVRVFHWALVISFIIAYASQEDGQRLHIYAGYGVLGLILFRLIWGFVGTKHARFSDFVRGPKEVLAYLRGLIAARPKHFLGHNPAGGWMVLVMILTLSVVSLSGLKLYAIEQGQGPFASEISLSPIGVAYADSDEYEDEKEGHHSEEEAFWEEVHEISANLMLFLIFLHVLAVVISSRLHQENLIKAMITGKKERQ